MAELIVRPVGAAAAALLARLHAASFRQAWSAAAWDELLRSPGTCALLASEGDRPAGFALIRQAADEAEIVSIAVLPARRRRGVAQALIQAIGTQLAASGARACFLEVAVDNDPAIALYARNGFREVGRRPRYYRNGPEAVDALVLRRDLAS